MIRETTIADLTAVDRVKQATEPWHVATVASQELWFAGNPPSWPFHLAQEHHRVHASRYQPPLTMHLFTTMTVGGGNRDLVDRVTLHVRALGVTRTQGFTFGDSFNPLWLSIGGVDDQGRTCDVNPPATTQ